MPLIIKAIAAMSENRVIGKDNELPWDIPEDMQHFVRLTKGHSVLMGRKTFDSLPANFKPLPNRQNIVVTRSPEQQEEIELVTYISDLDDFLLKCRAGEVSLPTDTLWIIGGAEIYRQTKDKWDEAYITLVKGQYEGDAYFPPFEEEFSLASEQEIEPCIFRHYVRK